MVACHVLFKVLRHIVLVLANSEGFANGIVWELASIGERFQVCEQAKQPGNKAHKQQQG